MGLPGQSSEEAMDEEAAPCPTMEANQSPGVGIPDGRTNEEVGEQSKAPD